MKPCLWHGAVAWSFQFVAAVLLGQTLFFKFSGAEESRFIFTTLGVEPWGRILTAILELVAVLLLLTPRGAVFGALLSACLAAGAIFSHLTRLGLVVMDDGGLLFGLAVTVLCSALAVVWLRWSELFRSGTASATGVLKSNRE